MIEFFLEPEDAEAMISAVRADEPELAEKLRVEPIEELTEPMRREPGEGRRLRLARVDGPHVARALQHPGEGMTAVHDLPVGARGELGSEIAGS